MINTAVAGDFYKRTHRKKYLIIGTGWFLWEISGLLPLLLFAIEDKYLIDLIVFHDAFFSVLAVIALCWGYIRFITHRYNPKKLVFSFIIGFIAINYVLFFIFGFSFIIHFASLMMNITWIATVSFLILNWNKFEEKNNKNNKGKKWYLYAIAILIYGYLPIGFIILINDYPFGLYFVENTLIIILDYGYLLIMTILLTLFTLYLEFRVSDTNKQQLKDKYSNEVGNALQGIFTAIDLLEEKIKNVDEDEKSEISKLLKKKKKEASDLM
jgi:hypothetical protein